MSRNRKFLRPFTGVGDVMSEDVGQSTPVPEQYPGDDQANQTFRQEEEVGGQPQAVDVGVGDNTVEQVSSPALPRGLNARGAAAGESPRYPGRVRRKPIRFKDFDMDDSG